MIARRIIPTGCFRAVLLDGPAITVQVIAADVLRWEQNNKAAFVSPDGGMPLSRMAWIVWAAAKRTHQTDLTVEQWLNSLAELEDLTDRSPTAELGQEAPLPDPTEAATTV